MTEKKKKHTIQPNTSRTKFIFVWIGGTLIGWFVGMTFALFLVMFISLMLTGKPYPEASRSILVYLIFMPASGCIGYYQQLALRDHLNIHIRSWWWLTALMWSVGVYIALNLRDFYGGSMATRAMWETSTFYGIVLGVPGIVQTALLRQHVSQAWLYGFSTVIGGIIWGALLNQDSGELWFFAPAISAVVTAIVLLWLTSATTARLSIAKDKTKPQT